MDYIDGILDCYTFNSCDIIVQEFPWLFKYIFKIISGTIDGFSVIVR